MEIPQIAVDELERLQQAGAPVLDVRTIDEYEEAHVAGAVLIPLAEVPDRLDEIPSGDPLLVICRTGARSQRACEFLAEQGISASNIAGGTKAWIESGRPVVAGPDPA